MRERGVDGILDYYRGLKAGGSDRVGYSEQSLKAVVLRTVQPLPAERVVELGGGPNPVVPFELAGTGRTVTVVEISNDFCETARLNANRRGVDVEVVCAAAHATSLPSASFDLAILTEVLEHVPDELELPTLAEAHRVLRSGGWFFVSVPNEFGLLARYQRWRVGKQDNPEHLREYTHRRLAALLRKAGFVIDHAVRVPGTSGPLWRTRSGWVIDHVALRPELSFKVAFLARKPVAR